MPGMLGIDGTDVLMTPLYPKCTELVSALSVR